MLQKEEIKMTKNTFAGFKYKDLLTGEILTVKKVDQEGIKSCSKRFDYF